MTGTLTLFRTELTLLSRDTTAWGTAIAVPLLLGGAWIVSAPPFGDGWGAVIATQLVVLLAFTLHTVGVMALAGRRQELVLQRWHTTQASTMGILLGTMSVPVVLTLGQAALLTAITMAVAGASPASWPLLVVAVVTATATVTGLTFVAAAFTRSPEHAMITTAPVLIVLIGGSAWALLGDPIGSYGTLAALVPGVAATELTLAAWDGWTGPVWSTFRDAFIGAAALVALSVDGARRVFRFEPRR
jgi:ABC-2 type transport system permease protein